MGVRRRLEERTPKDVGIGRSLHGHRTQTGCPSLANNWKINDIFSLKITDVENQQSTFLGINEGGGCHSSDYHTSLYRIEGLKGVWYPWYREMAVSTCGCFCKQGIGRQHPHRGWRMRDEVSWARRRNLCRISFNRTIIRVYLPFFHWFGVILFAIFRLIWCHISFDRTKIRLYLPFFD